MAVPVMPEDLAGSLRQLAQERAFESYDQHESLIPELFDVRDMTPGRTWEEIQVNTADLKLKEREIGGDTDQSGALQEDYLILGKHRLFERSIMVPEDLVEALPVNQNAELKIREIIDEQSRIFGEEHALAEEEHAASLFLYGGYTSGHDVFNNTAKGSPADPGGKLLWDGKPHFNLSNNLRTAKSGDTYYNALSGVSFDATQVDALQVLVDNNNAYSNMRRRVKIGVDTCVVGEALKNKARRIFNAAALAGVTDNDANPWAKSTEGAIRPLVWSFLDDSDAFVLLRAKKGLRWYRPSPKMGPPLDIKTAYQIGNRSWVMSVQAKFCGVVTNWRYQGAANLPTS